MKLKDLYNMPFGEVLENYCVLWNLECGYPYGICSLELADKMYEKYNVQEYWEAMSTETLVHYELMYDDDCELVSWEKIERIMDNLGISKKDEQI